MPVFRPPLVRSAAVAAAATLDRSLFSKTVSISAARILNIKKISQHRTELTKTKELLRLDRLANIRSDPDPERASKGGKCFLLSPQVKPEGMN
jgi:tRNA (guanine37-N1)-methyltransferase